MRALLVSSVLALALGGSADPNDWVNVDYVLKQSNGKPNSATTGAQNTIVSKAGSTAKDGPWTIATKGIKPPSGDYRDYLSWAPYHWPACNWCGKGSTHFASPNSTEPEDDAGNEFNPEPSDDDGGDSAKDPVDDGNSQVEDLRAEIVNANFIAEDTHARLANSLDMHHRMRRIHRSLGDGLEQYERDNAQNARRQQAAPALPVDPGTVLPAPTVPPGTVMPQMPTTLPGSSTSTSNHVAGTQAPAQAPAKTQTQGKCTPSPTKSLAPSATWTTCPYVVRDGKVNPDTNMLVGPDSAGSMSQSVLYNAIAYTLQRNSGNSQNVAQAIDAFFLSTTTGMHPNVNFGQLVRGPGKAHQVGTFTGILDLRGTVKVANAIQLLRNTKSPDWTPAREQAMTSWMKSYISWLQTSDIGKETASKANNHLTFYVSQLAAAKYFVGDSKGAATVLQNYFKGQFMDQIAQSGEQPFESVRTRPFHYRCFNLEAMITNAKLGDQLGLNFWTAKSKYGATIQTALDYTMAVGPKGEQLSDIFPHVAAVSAAYGDPKGKYAAFLQKNVNSYQSMPFWFYDQSSALPNSPAGKAKRSDDADPSTSGPDTSSNSTEPVDGADPVGSASSTIPFECPAVFDDASSVELEDGLFVTCDELKPFFEMPSPVDTSV